MLLQKRFLYHKKNNTLHRFLNQKIENLTKKMKKQPNQKPKTNFWLITTVCSFLFITACGGAKEATKSTAHQSHNSEKLEELPMPTDTQPTDSTANAELMKQLMEALGMGGETEQNKNATTFNPAEYKASATRTNDLIHTKLDLTLDWQKQQINGKATLKLKPYFNPTNQLTLDAKGFDIKKVVLLPNNSPQKNLKYTYTDSLHLNIELDKTYTAKEEYIIEIDYTAKPDQAANSGLVKSDDKGGYFIDPTQTDPLRPTEFWTQGETDAASAWFPTIDHPNERASQELIITTEKKYVTLSNGKLISSKENPNGTRTDYWKQDLPHAPYLHLLVVGDFAVVKDKWRDKEVNYYIEPEYKDHAKAIFGNTPKMIEFFSQKLIDYPWDKYHQVIVRDFVSGAMENTGAVTFFEDMLATTRELIDSDHEDIIAHELFHHWFGDLVTCESWSNIPLNESFATYGEYLWIEHQYSRDDADYHLQQDLDNYFGENSYKSVPIFRYNYSDTDDLFDRHTYQKGGRVLHMLRKYVGDEAFFASLKKYLTDNKYKSVELSDLRKAFEEITGEDLTWFFMQWFLQPAHPILDINYSYDTQLKKARVTIKQLQKNGVIYKLPLPLDIYYPNGTVERKNLLLQETEQTFTFDAPQKPALMNYDAEKVLLGEKTENKSAEEYLFQYQHAPLFLDRLEALDFLLEKTDLDAVKNIIPLALKDKSWVLRRNTLKKLQHPQNQELAKSNITTILDIAKNDKKSLVRAEAIETLGKMQDKSYLPLFNQLLTDQSYAVQASALYSLYKTDPKQALEAAKKMETEKNMTIKTIVAQMYAETGDNTKTKFFDETMNNANGFEKMALLEHYLRFLKRTGATTTKQAIPTLQNMAINENTWFMRLYGTQALAELKRHFEDLKTDQSLVDELKKSIQKIKETEKDEKLKNMYEGF